MSQPKVSVIIPVYNLELYLRRCLDSVVCQTLKDIEIICVNDGSTDGSPAILREYEGTDSRVRVADQENSGPGLARNTGIRMARGEYIGFVDGDDRVEPEMYEKMYSAAKKNDSDMQVCTIRWLDGDGRDMQLACDYDQYLGGRFGGGSVVFNRHDIADEIFMLNRFCWNKIYKMSFLEAHNIFFSPHRQFEDHVFHFLAFIKAERISMIRKSFYHYYKYRPGSLTARKERPLLLFDAIEHVQQALDEDNVEKELIERFDKFKIRWSTAIYYMAHRDLKEEYFNRMRSVFCGMDISENPFIGHGERFFYLCARSLPHRLYRYTDIGISLYINIFNKRLKNVMRPFG